MKYIDNKLNADKVNIKDEKDIYKSKNVEGALEEVGSQIKSIENNIQNVGQPTDEQVANVINAAIAKGEIVAGGITTTAQTLLISILRKAVYTSDQSANIDALATALASSSSGGGTETTQYTITNSLSNSTSSNATVLVDANASYSATITVNDGYSLDTITVTMGGTDITSTAVSGTTITISAVTGNVVITVTTTATSSGGSGGNIITNGLVNYFDFRSATYNNNGAGGATIISATQGNGSLYCWAKNMVTAQDDYGMKIGRQMMYAGNGGTSSTNCGTSFTWVFKCYMNSEISPLMSNDYGALSNLVAFSYKPKYNTSSSTAQVSAENISNRKSGYNTYIITVDGNTCKLYENSTLLKTIDGSSISDFVSWYDKLNVTILGDNTSGYYSQIAVYNKALSEVEIVDMVDYLTTLEVK